MPIAAFAAAVLVIIPFVLQRTLVRNLPLAAVAIWMSLANVIRGVNSLVWAGSIATRVPVWCDITTKIQIGSLYALPAASFCVASNLRMAASQHVVPVLRSEQEERRTVIFEVAMCVGMPLLAMILHLVVQNHRFDIIEDVGCVPGASATIAAAFFWMPALVVGALSLALCCASWRNVVGPNRGWLAAYLERFDPGLNVYLFLSQTMVVLSLSCLSVAAIITTVVESSLRPSVPEDSRAWSRIDAFWFENLGALSKQNQLFCWWALPAAALSFCLWFAALPAAEAGDRAFQRIVRRIRRRGSSDETVISLQDLELAKSSPLRVVVRKQSTIEIRVDDYADPDVLDGGVVHQEDEERDKKWTTPWEFGSSEGQRFSLEQPSTFPTHTPPTVPQNAHTIPRRAAH